MPTITKYPDCQYLEESQLPTLVLAVPQKYDFKKGRIWQGIAHQTAGHGCHQHYMYGTILKPKSEIVEKIQHINKHWLDSDCGWAREATLDEILKYRKQLQELLGVDCNQSYADFEEGIYPIDCTIENLGKLTAEKFPKELDSLIRWNKDEPYFHRADWKLYLLGENCD